MTDRRASGLPWRRARDHFALAVLALGVLAVLAACGRDGVAKAGPTAAPAVDAAAAVVAPPGPAPAPTRAPPQLVAIDVFGSRHLTLAQLLAAQEKQLRAFAAASFGDGPAVPMTIEDDIHELGDFAHVSIALVGYYEPEGMKYYLTVDLVDREDAARRMAFRPAPTGEYQDPEGLIADWWAYEAKVHELMNTGVLTNERVECPAFHCWGDPAHPELEPLADKFVARVPEHVFELTTILYDDRDVRRRAAAAYLLAYMKDGPALVELLRPAFRDGDMLVRNNALRVLADITFFRPGVEVPIEPVLEALEYPETLDRNKAAAILHGLLGRPGAARLHEPIKRRAGRTLLAMLRLEQPNNHDWAYKVLKAISGQSFDERDHASWAAWLKTR